MKSLITSLSLVISFTVTANVSSDITNGLKDTLNEELFESDGKVKSLKCYNTFSGVFCYSTLEFIDIGSFESGHNGSSYTCDETYYYLGFEQKMYVTLCSTCWYNNEEDFYSKSCQNN